jgi:uncharacterized protein (TIGR02391 family)
MDLVAAVGNKLIKGMSLTRAWRPISRNHISSMVDGIRNKIFDYAFNLKSTNIDITNIKKDDSQTEAENIFDTINLHPVIVNASKSLYESQHYASAIFEAFKAVNNYVKVKTKLPLDGKDLMAQAFREDNPVLKLNRLRTLSDKNEQEGFKFIFMGAIVGIRNPKAHDSITQTDKNKTLEYLALASLLIRIAEQGKLGRPKTKNRKQ